MTTAFITNATIISMYELDVEKTFEQQFSIVSLENIIFSIIAYVIFVHEQIVSTNAENSRPHNVPWYLATAKAFLDGLPLVWQDGQFKYDLTGVTDADERQIIDRCAVLESADGDLVLKIATDNGGVIEPLTSEQFTRFVAYMNLVKDAGNRLRFVNQPADLLKLNLTIYVDPLIIDLTTGKQLNVDGDVHPVKEAINTYLANLEFNGAYVKTYLQDALQKATGVKLPLINSVEWKFAGFSFVTIGEIKIPEAGYFKINEEDLTINYIAYDLATL